MNHRLLDGSAIQLECSEFQEISKGYLNEGTIRSARCESAENVWSYTNAVVMNDEGGAIWMLHHLSPDMPPVELRLNGADESNGFAEFNLQEFGL